MHPDSVVRTILSRVPAPRIAPAAGVAGTPGGIVVDAPSYDTTAYPVAPTASYPTTTYPTTDSAQRTA